MSHSKSIFKTILIYTSIIVIISVFGLWTWLYTAFVSPLESQFLGQTLAETAIDIEQRMHGKLEEGKAIATSIVAYRGILDGLTEESSDMIFEEISPIQDRFASLSKYQNILTKVINSDDEVMSVAWDKNKTGALVASPLLSQMQKTNQVIGSYGVEEKGFGAIVFAPVMKDKKYLGAVQSFSGVGAVAKELQKEGVGWVLLLDKNYLKERYKKIPDSVAKNEVISDNYLLAHPKWFDSEAISYVKKHLNSKIPLAGYDIQLIGDKVLIDIPLYDDVYKVLGRHLIIKSAESLKHRIEEATIHVLWVLIFVIFVLIAVASIIIWLVKGHAIDQMNELVDTIEQVVHDGQFDVQLPIEEMNEVGRVYLAINHLLSNLNQAMIEIEHVVHAQADGNLTQNSTGDFHGQLKEVQISVNNASNKLKNIVSHSVKISNMVSETAAQVSLGASNLSARVQEQAAALEETSATMAEMTAAVEANTENANRVATLATQVQCNAQRGTQIMQETTHAMKEIQESSEKIHEIINLIDSISAKTNMLALNASVEAARAGEHGHGFAVVAMEVKQLSIKAVDAASEIKALINDSVKRIKHGTDYVEQSAKTFDNITQSIDDVTTMVKEIAYASGEQHLSIAHIHDAITEIDRITQENAALVEETTAAAENLSNEARELRKDMSYFKTS